MSSNGLTKAEARKLSYDEKLDLLDAGLTTLIEQFTELQDVLGRLADSQEEILEKLSNLRSPSGSGYELDAFGGDL